MVPQADTSVSGAPCIVNATRLVGKGGRHCDIYMELPVLLVAMSPHTRLIPKSPTGGMLYIQGTGTLILRGCVYCDTVVKGGEGLQPA